jgi:hypothetical protein
MAFGLPPKFEIEFDQERDRKEILEIATIAHKNLKWKLVQSSDYLVQYYRKQKSMMGRLFYPVGGCDITIRMNDNNKITIKSEGPNKGFMDSGLNKKNCEALAKELGIKI